MDARQQRALKSWVDRLKDKNQTLREKTTALKKENQMLQRTLRESRKLFKDIPGAVALVQDGKIILTNEAALKGLGNTEEEVLGRNFLEFIHPDSVEYVRNLHQKRLSGKSVPNQYETYLTTKNGETLCCEVLVKGIRYQGRKAFLLYIRGLDQRKKTETQLLRSQKMEAIVSMASGLSREFNDCLSILDDYALNHNGEGAPSEVTPNESLKRIEIIRKKCSSIRDKLATLEMVEYDETNTVNCDLRKIIRDSVASTRYLWKEDAEERGIKVDVKTYLRDVSPVEGNPDELKNIFINMILNAIDALPGGGEVYLTTEESAGYAYVYIQDNGVGIPDDIKDRIFDPFFTINDGSKVGLGLSIAYAAIKRHGGEVEVMSHKGQGTTFIIKLPIAQKHPSPKAGGAKKKINNSQILVIAEEGMVKDILSQLLVNKGGKVTTAYADIGWVKLLGKKKFDLVIADLNMSNLRSSKMISKIKKMHRDRPIILVNAEEGEEFGADLVIGRPLQMDRVLSLISEVLSKKGVA